ncbi:MAG TPA: diacylglycerol kinase family protein [Allosphingosinicella sp.]|nr:diacylglycerol kinase family protein [Allosphingosinicella sp.]
MRVRAIVNRGGGTLLKSGDDDPRTHLSAAFEAAGIQAEIRCVEGDGLAGEFRAAAEDPAVDIVVAGGGDGTISCAAGALADTDKPLGILPLGTLNHLARDAGIPTDLEGAVAIIAARHVRRIDVAEVNGRVFVNNSAIGLYPRMVRRREEEQERLGRSKRLAMLSASLHAFRRFSQHRLTIELHGLKAPLETPLLFVGNNVYETSLLTLGQRKALDQGELCLYAPMARGRLHFFSLGLRSLFGLGRQRDFASLTGITEAIVRSRRAALNVSLDGEATTIATPLRYRIRPGALGLIAPPPEEAR